MLGETMQQKISEQVASFPIENYPLCICLSFVEGQVQIVNVISAKDLFKVEMPDEKMLQCLQYARDSFDRRIVSPTATGQQGRPSTWFAT